MSKMTVHTVHNADGFISVIGIGVVVRGCRYSTGEASVVGSIYHAYS